MSKTYALQELIEEPDVRSGYLTDHPECEVLRPLLEFFAEYGEVMRDSLYIKHTKAVAAGQNWAQAALEEEPFNDQTRKEVDETFAEQIDLADQAIDAINDILYGPEPAGKPA